MKLDEELRGALTREAERRTAPPPDLVGMISGGRVRRRRRTAVRLGAVAAATVLVGSAAYGVARTDPAGWRAEIGPAGAPTGSSESPTTPPLPNDGGVIQSGATYRTVVGTDASGSLIEAHVTVHGVNWLPGDFPVAVGADRRTFAGFGVYQPSALAAGTGCVHDLSTRTAATTVDALTAQLARLPRSEVLLAPGPTRAFGYDALHLRLRVDVNCPQWYRVAQAPRGVRGITYTAPGADALDVIIDFWVLDVSGAPVVIDQWRNLDAPAGLVDRATRSRESITFVVD
jgi:hypothetical protein